MSLQYFEYISPSKIAMLLPQLTAWHDKLPRLSPKVEFAGLSVGAEINPPASAGLVAETRKVIRRLVDKELLTDATDQTAFHANSFYRANGVWRHGLYYIKAVTSTVVVYVVWRNCGSTLLLLVGSPANVIGGIVARDGQYISTTGNALECVGTGRLKEELESEPGLFSTESIHTEGKPQSDRMEQVEPLLFSPALDLANFSHRRLTGLRQGDMDVAFRLMSRHEAETGSLFRDLKKAYEHWTHRDRTPNPRVKPNPAWEREYESRQEQGWQDTMRLAEKSGWAGLNSVCVGSPLYTALGT